MPLGSAQERSPLCGMGAVGLRVGACDRSPSRREPLSGARLPVPVTAVSAATGSPFRLSLVSRRLGWCPPGAAPGASLAVAACARGRRPSLRCVAVG